MNQRGCVAEGEIDVVKSDDHRKLRGQGFSGGHDVGYPKFTNSGSSKEVMMKIQTDATTTALVVERPTPCVPPVVLMP